MTVTVAGASVMFKDKGTPMSSCEDVNKDRLLDIIIHVSTDALILTESDTEAVLEGRIFNGKAFT
jgi:hypothetical protein